MYIYKVIEVKQKTFTKGYMTTYDLQNVINEWSCKNWELDRIMSGETQHFIGAKDVFIIIFKKKIDFPQDLFIMVGNQKPQRPITPEEFRIFATQKQITMQSLSCKVGENEWNPLIKVAPELSEAILFYAFFK